MFSWRVRGERVGFWRGAELRVRMCQLGVCEMRKGVCWVKRTSCQLVALDHWGLEWIQNASAVLDVSKCVELPSFSRIRTLSSLDPPHDFAPLVYISAPSVLPCQASRNSIFHFPQDRSCSCSMCLLQTLFLAAYVAVDTSPILSVPGFSQEYPQLALP